MSLKPTYNIVYRDLLITYKCFYCEKINQAEKAFTRICHNSKEAEHNVYHKLWKLMGKPQGNPEYGRDAFWDCNGIRIEAAKKAEAIYNYILELRVDAF